METSAHINHIANHLIKMGFSESLAKKYAPMFLEYRIEPHQVVQLMDMLTQVEWEIEPELEKWVCEEKKRIIKEDPACNTFEYWTNLNLNKERR
jgi:hypothetical protein